MSQRPKHDVPQYLPSTTRAVAWGALFFSILAFLLSAATLFLTWRDGRLVENLGKFSQEIRESISTRIENQEKDGAENGTSQRPKAAVEPDEREEASPPESSIRWDRLRESLDRIQGKIRDGDESARFYLDELRDEMRSLQKYSSEKSGVWLDRAIETVGNARQEIAENAPEAAAKLRVLAGELREKASGIQWKSGDKANTLENEKQKRSADESDSSNPGGSTGNGVSSTQSND